MSIEPSDKRGSSGPSGLRSAPWLSVATATST
jgi:hypothetical protein